MRRRRSVAARRLEPAARRGADGARARSAGLVASWRRVDRAHRDAPAGAGRRRRAPTATGARSPATPRSSRSLTGPVADRRARARDRRRRATSRPAARSRRSRSPSRSRTSCAACSPTPRSAPRSCPVFTELLEKGRKREAFRLASTLFFLILTVLGAITALFIVFAGVIMPLFTGDDVHAAARRPHRRASPRCCSRSSLLLGLNGLLVGILNAYDHFTIPALAPLVWNIVIIVLPGRLQPLLRRRRPALRLRDRRPRRHGRAVRDGAAGAAPRSASGSSSRSTGATRGSGRCSR